MEELTDIQRKKAMKNVVIAQCFGSHGLLAFQNSLLLLYFLTLGISKVRVIFLLSLYGFSVGLSILPAAYFSDKLGKKKVGTLGTVMCSIGFVILACTGFLPVKWLYIPCIVLGIAVFSFGSGFMTTSWFALLKPIVPAEVRGRFFANLRISWQLVGIVISGIIAWILKMYNNTFAFQLLVFLVAALLIGRTFFYIRIPELNFVKAKNLNFKKGIWDTVTINGFASYGAYIFLIYLFVSCCPSFFAVIEKDVLKLEQSTVVWLANLYLVGSLVGFFAGGQAVDRLGTKSVFMFCHFAYAIILFLFLMRSYSEFITIPLLCFCHFSFGFVWAASSIAVTSENLSLIPMHNQSMAAGLLRMAQMIGIALSSFASAAIIDLGMLKNEWFFLGMKMTDFDSILLINAAMLTMLVITLGLVPSVVKKAEWYPNN